MTTSEYIVTKAAPPRVAGRAVKPGDTITLTELQARAEVLAGSIVARAVDAEKEGPAPEGTFSTTGALADIQARARGRAGAEVVAEQPKTEASVETKLIPGTDPLAQKMAGSADAGGQAPAADDVKADGAPADAGNEAGKRGGKSASGSVISSTGA